LLACRYPSVEFRPVGADLSSATPNAYMEPLVAATADLTAARIPALIFNNAGYMATGLFADSPVARSAKNHHCNATCSIYITHHFVNLLLNAKRKGAVFFTSSPAGLNAAPSVSMYAATKAWMTSFGNSLAAELRPDGIDVLVVHPSPVDTAFYSGNSLELGAVKFFQKTAGKATSVASCFFVSIGRLVNHDQGYYLVVFRLLLKLIDLNFFNQIIAWTSAGTADFKKAKQPRDQNGVIATAPAAPAPAAVADTKAN